MNTEPRLVHNITSSNKHGKSAKDNRITDLVKLLDMPETASGSNVQSTNPLLTISQKGPEDMMASM